MDVGNLTKAEDDDASNLFLANLQAEHLKQATAGNWEGAEILANTLYQFSKGKGKGRGKDGYGGKNSYGDRGGYGGYGGKDSGGGKNGGKGFGKFGKADYGGKGFGKNGGKAGKSAEYFDGDCNHCGKHGHRKKDCRALDAEMARIRGGKGGGMNNLDDQDQQGEADIQSGADTPSEEDLWWMGGTFQLSYGSKQPETLDYTMKNQYGALEVEEEIDYGETFGPTLQESMHGAAFAGQCLPGGSDECGTCGGNSVGF